MIYKNGEEVQEQADNIEKVGVVADLETHISKFNNKTN